MVPDHAPATKLSAIERLGAGVALAEIQQPSDVTFRLFDWNRVGTDGKPTACRVARPSRDAEANAITCRLALQRFRFR